MKVNIGPYRTWIGPYQIADAIFFWQDKWSYDPKLEERWDYVLKDKFGDWLATSWVNDFCQWIDSKKKRKIKIKLHNYDTWSADHTLSLIIVPVLKQLQATKHGAPHVDDEDVPNYLRSTNAKPKQNEHDTDEFHFKRWDWVLDEMIWAFSQVIDDDAEDQFYETIESNEPGSLFGKKLKVDDDGLKKWYERKSNGFRLFGKYYEGLWD